MAGTAAQLEEKPGGLVRGLGLLDSIMIVAGSMIGSGIFIVSADIARQVGSAGWLLAVWGITGVLTVAAALSYAELAAMMPRAGGQYVYLRECYSPLWGFLYGWASFLVIQTGTIAAVAIAFSRFLGVAAPGVSPTTWIVEPINLSPYHAVSLSVQQLVAILLIVLLTALNTRGLVLGKTIQNSFTLAKTLALLALIVLGITIGYNQTAVDRNFTDLWTPAGATPIVPDISGLPFAPAISAASGALGLLVALAVAQVGSLFSSDSWHSVTFTGGEVKNPRRNLPLALVIGTVLVISLYVLANVAYLLILPLEEIQGAREDRVGTAALEAIFGAAGAVIMAVAIMISTFGCNNGLILAGARVTYAMAQDGLFFRGLAKLNSWHVPSRALTVQCIWASLLVLLRTRRRDEAGRPIVDAATGLEEYGNLYSNLLDYVVFAVLIFYVLTIAGIFVLRRKKPEAERPYRALGYPVVQALYIAAAMLILCVLLVYRTQTTWPGLIIVLTGIPVYFFWHRLRPARGAPPVDGPGRPGA
ncbi:MAG TPA: amino acid permease [Planctomycetota bacterium]|nr:amino acid permease [Planctomycetota bacterium]